LATLLAGFAAAGAVAYWHDAAQLKASSIQIGVLVALHVLSHTIPSRLSTVGGAAESIAHDDVLFPAMLMLLSPTWFSLSVVAASTAGSLVVRRSPEKALFNCGEYLLACLTGYLVYHALAGPNASELTLRTVAAACVGAVVIAATSRLAVALMIAFVTRRPVDPRQLVPRELAAAWLGAAILGASGFGLAYTYDWGILPVAGLIVFVQRAFVVQAKEQAARLQAERLQQHTSALRQTGNRHAIEASLTASAAELVGSRDATIVEADAHLPAGALTAPMSNGQQLAVHGRIGPGTWSLQERETLTSLAGVAADTLRSVDLIAHLRNITDGQSEAVIAVDTTGTVTFANPAAVRVLGTESVERTVGMAVADVCHLQSNGKEIDLLSVAGKGITVEDADAVLVVENADGVDRPTGHTLDVSYSCSPLAEGDDISGAVLVMRDVSERRAFQDAMTYRAMHDELTGLPNRRSFLERLDAALQEETQNALIFFDLDRFKLVNDSFGHLVGDQLLIQFSQRLTRHSDPHGITARLSGDEFVMLLPGRTDDVDLTSVVGSLITDLREPYLVDGNAIFITVSLGVASTLTGQLRDDVLLAADAASYAAKSSGGDCVRFVTPELVAATRQRLETEAQLRSAIDSGGLHLHYQPIIDTKTRCMVSVEALVRWNRDGVTMSPAEFIPLAEDSGLIVYLGRWVLEEACRTTRRRNIAHPDRVPITVSVNLSALQLAQPRVAEEVRKVLQDTGLPPEQLTLEITETAVLADIASNLTTLRELRALGVRLSVDDFGTGYSSLAYLRQLPVDVVKLDASFISGLGVDPIDAHFVALVLRLCKALGHQVVAEGVETEVQRQMLAYMGSTFMQGYLLARPMDDEEFEQFWATMYQAPLQRLSMP
jgi:diguanylate cyclase (GGDEF)-like protein/PAS domain S-box-containing protein